MLRFLVLALAFVAPWVWPIDYAREQRWAQEITPAILVGEPVYLSLASGHKFLAIYENPAKPKAAVIVVHGAGVHPDWGLINILRSKLPESGYATLSVQMPVLAADAKAEQYPPTFPEASERLRVAVEFLRTKGHKRIAIAAHSLGASMSNHFLVNDPKPGIAAWASLGIVGNGEFEQPQRLAIPILDLYGERDYPQVLAAADARAAVLRRIKGSAQIQIEGADHFFNGKETEMVRWVKEFLDRVLTR
jgi:pimeloyl-ACP methyl ester carboxylesterase